MAKPKKQKTTETELPAEIVAEAAETDAAAETPETVEVVAAAPAEAPEAVEPEKVEEVAPAEPEPAVVAPEPEAEIVPDGPATPDSEAKELASKINEFLVKNGSELRAQAANVNASLSYVLVKSPSSTYCFGRIPVERADKNPKRSVELLSNIPVKAHTDIAAATKEAGVPISSRLFFHASGML